MPDANCPFCGPSFIGDCAHQPKVYSNRRFKKNYKLDGWPIADNKHKSILSNDDLVRLLNDLHEENERMREAFK